MCVDTILPECSQTVKSEGSQEIAQRKLIENSSRVLPKIFKKDIDWTYSVANIVWCDTNKVL